ncbi:MAG: metallophosphoesterase [Labilithrix sp.]|nr:metallophosphoesterase [Labilithrix sp.]MCW5815309.1 metallophosphoesterase [Labilithrix sp.]
MLRFVAFGAFVALAFLACADSGDGGGGAGLDAGPPPAPTIAPLTETPPTTVDKTLVPKTARVDPSTTKNPSFPDVLAGMLEQGFGELGAGSGDAYVTRTLDDSTPPPPGPNAKRLTRFVHLADLQIADDETPTRLGNFDSPGLTSSALRPQDPYLCRMGNAAVRTINALHAKDPIDFTVTGGDNADNAQVNEVDWVLGFLSGSPSVKCDSGDDTDLVPGPANDPKDAFAAEGLAMPWWWVTGNHDILVQGNFDIALRNSVAIGTDASGGTRNYRDGKPGTVESGNFVVPDPRRALLSRKDLMAKVGADKDGHGIGAKEKETGRATYTFDVEGTPLRFLILDTAHETGGAEGVITRRHVDDHIKEMLDTAKRDGKFVILSSHHAATSLSKGDGLGGSPEPDALLTQDWADFIGNYDNVVFSMVGHSHRHRVQAVRATNGHAYWEVMTAAIADYPHQFRIAEIYDQDNGWLMLRATGVDIAVEGDEVAEEGRRRGVVDFTSGWLPVDDVTAKDKNVEVWVKKP